MTRTFPRAATALLPAFAALAALSPNAGAQTLHQTALIQGQHAELRVRGANPGDAVAFVSSFSGIGAGTCYPAPFSVCFDILEPAFYLFITPVGANGEAHLPLVIPRSAPLIPIFTQGFVVDPTTLSGSLTQAIAGQIEPISALSDTFDGPTLSSDWQIHNGHLASHRIANGALELTSLVGGPSASWFANGEGPLIYKYVRGDFTASAILRVRSMTQPSAGPPLDFNLAGMTMRDPHAPPGDHDWAHVAVGAGTNAIPIAVEDKSTVDSVSDLRLHPIPSTQGEIRLRRRGPTVSMYYRTDATASWQLLRSHHRPDLPAVLQVGMMLTMWTTPPDLVATFDQIVFSD